MLQSNIGKVDQKKEFYFNLGNPFSTEQPERFHFRTSAYSDRFIPSRPSNAHLESLILESASYMQNNHNDSDSNELDTETTSPDSNINRPMSNYSALLESQILSTDSFYLPTSGSLSHQSNFAAPNESSTLTCTSNKVSRGILCYKNRRQSRNDFENLNPNLPSIGTYGSELSDDRINSKISKPLTTRKIAKTPYKILDAPSLVDDFYLNLLDWSSTNHISIGLQNAVYVWSATTNKAHKAHETTPGESTICSVAFNQTSSYLAIGESNGKVKIYDTETGKLSREMLGHSCRVGSISWNGSLFSSGSRDKSILTRDIRENSQYIYKLTGHQQEICGLKWSPDGSYIASGGNDNKVFIWSHKTQAEAARFTEHTAAVKALAWSPHQHNLLATGGGKSDKTIKFWNVGTLRKIDSIDTGSQVCNMMFSVNSNELVSTHGYSMNEICVWNYPNMQKQATLMGHTSRVLYMGMSPDGESIVTGAGDETLRFWNLFPAKKDKNDDVFKRSSVNLSIVDLR